MLTEGEVWVNAGYSKADASDTSAMYVACVLICIGMVSGIFVLMNPM